MNRFNRDHSCRAMCLLLATCISGTPSSVLARLRADPSAPGTAPASVVVIVPPASPATVPWFSVATTASNLSGVPTASIALVPLDCDTAGDLYSMLVLAGGEFPPPVDSTGDPLPPPLELPPGSNGLPNSWVPDDGTEDRPTRWKPKYPVPSKKGGQPSASWDPEGHWDADTGLKERMRVRPDGKLLDDQHPPTVSPDQTVLPPYIAIDPETVRKAIEAGFWVGLGGVVFWFAFGAWQIVCGGS